MLMTLLRLWEEQKRKVLESKPKKNVLETSKFEIGLVGAIIIGYVGMMIFGFYVLPLSLFAIVVIVSVLVYAIPSLWYSHYMKNQAVLLPESIVEDSEEVVEITIEPSQISYDLENMEPYTTVVQ